jgi:hypothetical protein
MPPPPPPAPAAKGRAGSSGTRKGKGPKQAADGAPRDRSSSITSRDQKAAALAASGAGGEHLSRRDQTKRPVVHGRGRGKPTSTITDPGEGPSPFSGLTFQAVSGSHTVLVLGADGKAVGQLHTSQFLQEPLPATSAPPGQFEDVGDEVEVLTDSAGFRPSPEELKKAKWAEGRKRREEEHAEFFANGGTHEQLHDFLRQREKDAAAKRAGGKKSKPAFSTPAQHKRAHGGTPTGLTPVAKAPRNITPTHVIQAGKTWAGDSIIHAERQRQLQKKRAAAARTAAREANPHALFVYTGKQEKGTLTQEQFLDFKAALARAILANALSPRKVLLSCEFTNWHAKKFCAHLNCRDEATATWFTNTIADLEVKGLTFRAYPAAGNEFGMANFNARDLCLSPPEILQLALAFNPWLGGARLAKPGFVTVAHTTDPHVEIILTDDAAKELGLRKWRLDLGSDVRRVHYYNRHELAKRLHDASDPVADRFREVALEDDPSRVTATATSEVIAMDTSEHPAGDSGAARAALTTLQEEEIGEDEANDLLRSSPPSDSD